jgi:hypothetical protein
VVPVIQSFEVLSDRISNLEDGINLLLGTARHREVRTYGPLDHRLLGLPCPTMRFPDDSGEMPEPEKRRENEAQSRVNAMIFEFHGLDILRECHGSEDLCTKPCTGGLYLTPSERARLGGRCCACQAAAMHTTQEWVCEEILARQLEHARLSSAILGRCITFLPCFKGEHFSILITCGLPVGVCDLLTETLRLLAKVSSTRPHHINAYDCFPELIVDYQNLLAKAFTGNGAHRMAAEAFCRRYRVAVEALRFHVFFSGVLDNIPWTLDQ